MRIEIGNYYGISKNSTSKKTLESKSNLPKKTVNEDKIEFSSFSEVKEYSLSKAKNDVLQTIKSDTDVNRLNELKSQIQNNSYNVSSTTIASSILGINISA